MPPDLHESPNSANNQCGQLCQSTMLPSTHTMAEPARSKLPVLATSPAIADVRLKDSTISHNHKKTHNQAFQDTFTIHIPPRTAIKMPLVTIPRIVTRSILIAVLGGGGGGAQIENPKNNKKQQTSLPTEFLNPPSPPRAAIKTSVATSRREVATDVLIAALGGGGVQRKTKKTRKK